ncbi:hypothetical protein SAMN05443377_1072 [Propionibacterium cyclohexanicum]|uniref:Lipoprotein n=1 Tax=Propionibacterium cyclohexanicum TaxID=64702 RepID=A0A1H9RGB7_9ACTN|nr:hypothetical protein SAMN05443377_1072 [Propionibacterium cyclohexanicum]
MSGHARTTRRALLGAAGAGLVALGLAGCSTTATTVPPAAGAMVSANGVRDLRDEQQAANMAIITGEAIRRGLPPRAVSIAIVTAMQESKLYNLDYGDRDSVGLFQQRPSQGWGTAAQIMDPWYSAGKFYDALVQVRDWQNDPINDVAQAVQRSGVPDGYAEHEPLGRAWASALTGHDPAAVTMVDRSNAPGDPEALREFLARVWPSGLSVTPTASGLDIQAPDHTTAWSLAQLLICRGPASGLVSLQVGPVTWQNSGTARNPWQGTDDASATQVQMGTRTP